MIQQAPLRPADAKPLIVLLGPTAVGKTELSLRLCERFGGEVVSADSRQLYRTMDVGTAKATPEERHRVPHHLIDIRDPDQVLTVAEYQRLAYATIDSIHAAGKTPFLVGGTALYVRAVVLGLRIPEVPPAPDLRFELEAELAANGLAALVTRLQQVDPLGAAVIDLKNPRRVLRGLEIALVTGKSKVELEGADAPPYSVLQIGLTRAREHLYARIDQRIDEMVKNGLIEETMRLLELGYSPKLPALTSLGYREIGDYLAGALTLEEATTRIKHETHRFVRHQMTWFRKMADIVWFDLDEVGEAQIAATVAGFLGKRSDES